MSRVIYSVQSLRVLIIKGAFTWTIQSDFKNQTEDSDATLDHEYEGDEYEGKSDKKDISLSHL